MAEDGCLIIDSNLYMGVPDDLWARVFCAGDIMGSNTGGYHPAAISQDDHSLHEWSVSEKIKDRPQPTG